ncbi:hypothetical protein, partial [Klebsiella pneumoniae]|uniref:hypothetical protein n=1 Tax=Klebsiella pneumoniae TaxID=573 RepID=UPI00358F625F
MRVDHDVTPDIHTTSKWIKALNGILETVQLLGDNPGSLLFAIWLGCLFGRSTCQWAKATKETKNKRDSI